MEGLWKMMLYTYESWWRHQIFQRSYHKWLFLAWDTHIEILLKGPGLWCEKTHRFSAFTWQSFFAIIIPLIMKYIKTGLTMALFPGHLGMRLCSNFMRHCKCILHLHSQNWTFDSCTLCVKYVHIVHCQLHCNTASTVPRPLLELTIRMMSFVKRIVIPKVYTCMNVYNTLVKEFFWILYIYYTPVYIFNFSTLVSNWFIMT